MIFPIYHLTESTSTKNICFVVSSGDTSAIEIKEIVCGQSPSGDLSNLHFTRYFSYEYAFLAYIDS